MVRDSREENAILLEEAAEWDRRLVTAEPGAKEAFADWIYASAAHLGAYLAHLIIEAELKKPDLK
jgi:ferric-dicitrate binding protein FerR (iron transport regulator)